MDNKMKICVLACLFLSLAGCRHRLEILNRADYEVVSLPTATSQKGLTVGLSANRQYADLIKMVASEMRKLGEYNVTIVDSQTTASELITDVDIVLRFDDLSGDGSWGNFFVCWPGFIVATHAWRGYRYVIDWSIRADIEFSNEDAKERTMRRTIEIKLDVRFSRTGTGASNHASYAIYPFFTIPAIINGFWNLSYDDHVTQEVHLVFDETAARFVAKELVVTINQKMKEVK